MVMLDLCSDDGSAGADRHRSPGIVAVEHDDLAAARSAIAPCFANTYSVEWKDLTATRGSRNAHDHL
jgi:hypothetical protein